MRQSHCNRPIRITLVTFVLLSTLLGVTMAVDARLRAVAHWGVLYCAVLTLASIGLARLDRHSMWIVGIPCVAALIPGLIGFALILQESQVNKAEIWLRASVYSFYGLAPWVGYWSARGWWLYKQDSRSKHMRP